MNKLVYQYSPSEVETALNVLNKAIENHRIWFDSLHTSMLCDQPFGQDIFHKAAHTQCQFGKWYYGEVSDSIKCIDEFTRLEPVHKYMHDHARTLVETFSENKTVELSQYQAFLSNQHHLIDLLTSLRDVLVQHEHCFDALTGAVNRKSISLLLERSFENLQRYRQKYSVAMLDVDHFKNINDQFGHVVGDQVLKHISIFFRESLRKSDCIGRYGGEEFLILLPETSHSEAVKLMEKARAELAAKEIMAGNSSINVTVSIGVSEVTHTDEDAWLAVQRADSSMYQAKSSGRNCVK